MITDKDLDRYAADIVSFAEEQFFCPESKKLIELETHQKRVLRDCLTASVSGLFPYQMVIYSAVKKSGKTTIAALVALWFALTQEPPNEIFIVANDFEQAQGRVFKTICGAIMLNPYLREATKITKNMIFFKSTGTTITALASDYAGAAGSNHGLTVWDELWAYTSESAHRLWDELTPVPTRRNSIRFIATYAGFEEESEPLWTLYKRGMKGKLLHDDLPIRVNKGLYMYWDHEPRMPWQTEQYYQQQKEDLRPHAYIRLHTNTWTTHTDSFIDIDWWDNCTASDHRPLMPTKKVLLSVGVDASTKRDSAAVVATYYDQEGKRVVLACHRIWQPSVKEPLDLENTLEAYLLDLYERYWLGIVFYDPWQFHRSATTLKNVHLPMQEYPQTSPNLTAASQNLFELLKHQNIVLYADEEMRKAASHAVAVESTRGWRLAKEKATHKIDVVVALAMSALGAIELTPEEEEEVIIYCEEAKIGEGEF